MGQKALGKVIVLLSVPLLSSLAAAQPRWTIENMTGKAPTYAGPSCYTAALLGLGYLKTMSSTGVKTIHYFVDNFCSKREGTPQPGDLLVLIHNDDKDKPEPYFDHVGIYLGGGKVFEKESGDGSWEQVYKQYDPSFHTVPMSQSYWFKNYAGENRFLTAFQCPEARVVHAKIAKCEARANELGVDRIQKAFEKNLFLTAPEYPLDASVLKAIHKYSKFMREVPEQDPCFDYFVAAADSINNDLKAIRDAAQAKMPNAREVQEARDDLWQTMWKRFTL